VQNEEGGHLLFDRGRPARSMVDTPLKTNCAWEQGEEIDFEIDFEIAWNELAVLRESALEAALRELALEEEAGRPCADRSS